MKKYLISAFTLFATIGYGQSLDELFETAVSNSHQAKMDKYADKKALALSDQAVGGTLPQISLSTQAQYNWISTAPFFEGTNAFQFQNANGGQQTSETTSTSNTPSTQQAFSFPDYLNQIQYNWNLHVEQTLNVFRLGTVYEGAQRLKKASALEAQLNRETLKLNVAQAYTQVFSSQDEVTLNQQILQAAQTTQQGAEIDFKSGRLPKLRLDLIQANAKVAEANLQISKSKLQQALENLEVMTGQSQSLESLSKPEEEISKFENLPRSSEENIQLKVMNAYLSYNDNLLEYQRTQAAPSFALMAGMNNQFQHTENLNPDLWDSPSRYIDPDYINYYVGVKMQWALFTGGSLSAKTREAEIDNKSQRIQLEKARDDLAIQQKQVAAQASGLKNSLEAALVAKHSNQLFYNQSQIDHKNGLMTYSELLQSEREFKESSQRLTMSRTAYLMTLIQLQLLNGQSIGAAQ